MSVTAWPPIELNDAGVALVAGTQTKVIEIALDRIAHHWDADEIRRQHPHLTLGQIHAALSYYYEHQDECDRLIEQRRQDGEAIRSATENEELQTRLRSLGRS